MTQPRTVTLEQAAQMLDIPLRRLYRWTSRRGKRSPTLHPMGVLDDGKTKLYHLDQVKAVAEATRRGRGTAAGRC